METPEYQQLNLEAHTYLAKLTLVSEVEVFKICLEYWNVLSADLYNESPFMMNNTSGRRGLYAPILSQVRLALIGRMAKPEEVLVVEDEGEIIREVSKDVDAIILYKSMKCAPASSPHSVCMYVYANACLSGRRWCTSPT